MEPPLALKPWLDLNLELVAAGVKDPPLASRGYSLTTVAIYDALVATYHWKHEYEREPPSGVTTLVSSGPDPSYPSEHAAIAGAASRVLAISSPSAPSGCSRPWPSRRPSRASTPGSTTAATWRRVSPSDAPSPSGCWRARSDGSAARLLAALNVAEHDAAVAVWDTKFTYWSARPVNAIRDLGLDPEWEPLLATPTFPGFVSATRGTRPPPPRCCRTSCRSSGRPSRPRPTRPRSPVSRRHPRPGRQRVRRRAPRLADSTAVARGEFLCSGGAPPGVGSALISFREGLDR